MILFDLGGVLVRTRPSWREICATVGLTWPFPHDLAWPEMPDYHAFESGQLSADAYLHRLAERLECTTEEARRAFNACLVGPYPGVESLLRVLVDRGEALGCLSNTNSLHWAELFSGQFQALAPLRHRFASFELGYEKPDPRIFAVVTQKLGVAPERIRFFDDKTENVRAARAAGWQAEPVGDDPVGDLRRLLSID
jgi:putative hydrolase of the HAD superfamily